MDLKGNGQLRTGRTELDVPHLGSKITYILPLIGPDYHEKVMRQVDSQNLYRPTTAHVISLIDLALQNPKEPNCEGILNRFMRNHLWTATGTISFKEGALVYDNTDGKMPQTSKELISLFEAKDKRVRFVKTGFKTGVMPLSEFLRHPYIIAQIGEEMLETAERIAKSCHKDEVYVFGLDKADSDTQRLTAVFSYSNGGLKLNGNYSNRNGSGCVLGIVDRYANL